MSYWLAGPSREAPGVSGGAQRPALPAPPRTAYGRGAKPAAGDGSSVRYIASSSSGRLSTKERSIFDKCLFVQDNLDHDKSAQVICQAPQDLDGAIVNSSSQGMPHLAAAGVEAMAPPCVASQMKSASKPSSPSSSSSAAAVNIQGMSITAQRCFSLSTFI